MGGTKKKSLGASSKSQDGSSPQAQPEKKDEKKTKGKQQKTKVTVLLDEKQGMKVLSGLKAVTPQALARNLGVKISVANAFIKSLESQGSVRPVGGYSGHRVYTLLQEMKPNVEEKKQPSVEEKKQETGLGRS